MVHPRRTLSESPAARPSGWRAASVGGTLAGLIALGLIGCADAQDAGTPESSSAAPTAEATSEEPEATPEESAEVESDAETESSGEDEGAETEGAEPDAADAEEDPPGSEDPAEDAAEVAAPVSFAIPAIEAGSELLHLGLRENGSLEVPPGAPGSPASWYTGSPAPGATGPSVLLGHVDDSAGQPGVFADLPQLVEGDEITVEQEGGGETTFVVTRAEQYGKDTFPTLQVYGNTEAAELRLITCDGYNEATGEYEDNYVVYATIAD